MKAGPLGLRVLLLLSLGLGPACDGEQEPPRPAVTRSAPQPVPQPEVPATGPLIAFLGDSLSAGLHVDADAAFPALLHRRLNASGSPFRLVNAGVSGDTTAGGLRRVEWLLAQDPDWVVVELGANDGLRGVDLASVEANLRAIVERVQAADVRVLLIGMKLPPNYGQDYTSGFSELFARVAEAYDVEFIPFLLEGVGGVPELNHPDGIHPTEEGHRRVADHLEPTLRRIVEATNSQASTP